MSEIYFDRSRISRFDLRARVNKITVSRDVFDLTDSVPKYVNPDLEELAKIIVEARSANKEVVWMMGAHVIRRGNSRFIIDLMKRGIITHVATNGAGAIHDFELARIGATCEDVEKYIKDGTFGNWTETGMQINLAAISAYESQVGFGEKLGELMNNAVRGDDRFTFAFPDLSIFGAAYKYGIPITIHKGIGYDITDQHSVADYAALGWASGRDFLVFAETISKLENGVFLNLGTQVMGPEIYLKALSMARNVANQEGKEIKNFATAVFDIIDIGDWKTEDDMLSPGYYFRPKKTILIRTVKDGGRSFYIKGDFRATVPALYHLIRKLDFRRWK